MKKYDKIPIVELEENTTPLQIVNQDLSFNTVFKRISKLAIPMGIDGVATGYALGVGGTAGALYLRWRDQIQVSKIGQPVLRHESKSYYSTCVCTMNRWCGKYSARNERLVTHQQVEELGLETKYNSTNSTQI